MLSDYDRWLLPPEPEPINGDFTVVLRGFGCEVDVRDDDVHAFAVVEVADEQVALEELQDAELAEAAPATCEEWLVLGAKLLAKLGEDEVMEAVIDQNEIPTRWV